MNLFSAFVIIYNVRLNLWIEILIFTIMQTRTAAVLKNSISLTPLLPFLSLCKKCHSRLYIKLQSHIIRILFRIHQFIKICHIPLSPGSPVPVSLPSAHIPKGRFVIYYGMQAAISTSPLIYFKQWKLSRSVKRIKNKDLQLHYTYRLLFFKAFS